MALATTTLSTAVTVTDNQIVVAAATSLAAGRYLRIDSEMLQVTKAYVVASTTVPVLRGVNGTAVAAHPVTANVVHGLASDFANPPAGVSDAITYPAQPWLPVYSYTTAGAIAPVQGIHVINGTALVMTLASPTRDQDGQLLIVCGNTAAAHTIQVVAGYGGGGGSYDIFTFAAGAAMALSMVACNGMWLLLTPAYGGTMTNLTASIA